MYRLRREEKRGKFSIYLRKEQWVGNKTHINVLGMFFSQSHQSLLLVGRGHMVLLSSGNQASPLSASEFRVDSISTGVDHVTCRRLSQHLLLVPLIIDLGMALYNPVRIKDKRRQFLNFWEIDLIKEEVLLTSVSLRTGPVGNVIISKEEE